MTQDSLKKILDKENEVMSVISEMMEMAGFPLQVLDANGESLYSAGMEEIKDPIERYPILYEEGIIGTVSGEAQAPLIAKLLTCLVATGNEMEGLLDEVLDLYRQINLLFHLSGKLGNSLNLSTIARLTLDDACRLIKATGGSVLLSDEGTSSYEAVFTFGDGIPSQKSFVPDDGLLYIIASRAKAEIINDVRSDQRYSTGKGSIHSLISAPLKSASKEFGSIVLVSVIQVAYKAADLNLLKALASLASPVIENAMMHQKLLQEAQEREERLRKQILELRIELNEARQQEKVAEITDSEFFQRLRDQADILRDIIGKK